MGRLVKRGGASFRRVYASFARKAWRGVCMSVWEGRLAAHVPPFPSRQGESSRRGLKERQCEAILKGKSCSDT